MAASAATPAALPRAGRACAGRPRPPTVDPVAPPAASRWLGALAGLAVLLAGCGDSGPPSCTAPGAGCTLGEAGRELGRFFGTTSEGPGWTRGPIGELVRRHFNSVTSQNELKWGPVEPEPGVYDFTRADETVAFAEANGLRMRGHVLFWHRASLPDWLPAELAAAHDAEARLRELMRERVETTMGRYRGRIHTWDVVNEPLALLSDQVDPSSIFYQTFASYDDFLDLAFELAREADPDAKLFLNEVFASVSDATFAGLHRLVKGMVERGTPIDGVGIQGHYVLALPDRDVLIERLRAFADLGLLVEITELDVSIRLLDDAPDPLAAQAEVYRDVYEACLAVDACIGVTTWNSNDGSTWLDRDPIFGARAPHRPTLFDTGLRPKPAYLAARDAVLAALRRAE